MTTSPATYAADLRGGDQFLNPANGELVTFAGWGSQDDEPCAFVQPGRRTAINLDPAQLVYVEGRVAL
jgi:hypothetical protein